MNAWPGRQEKQDGQPESASSHWLARFHEPRRTTGLLKRGAPMTYLLSATIDDLARTSGVRHDEKAALALALEYEQLGYKNIRVKTDDAEYSLERFRFL